uniref:Serine-rich adhesin for platelets isoform X3 n=1 Tax=Drosophila arizonae TaxID=7263 RepID=A0ABM1NVS1_DROAR
MEVATNNHSQSHHHHHHHHQHNRLGGAAVGSGNNVSSVGGSRSPFQREVREWQRIDPDTGALFSGRLEADRWINGPLNSYGKISDSQNISQPNGTQHTQRKQMEVLRTANGAMQVIRTQTVQKTSSTSRWSTSSSTTTTQQQHTTTTSTTNGGSRAPMALWAPRSAQGVDICELSEDDNDDDDEDDNDVKHHDEYSIHNGSDAGVVHECTTPSKSSTGHGQELVDDHVDFVVINGQADDDVDDDDDGGDGGDGDDGHLHKLGHNLLPDTAPSLKLSNLMKSSSSISSQSSNNSNLTTAAGGAGGAAGNNNTHRNAGKISLHAIVGQTATATAAAAAAAAAPATSSTWPQRLEQADLYGQSNNSNNSQKRRVGGAADVAAMGTPTLRRDLESFRHYNDDDATSIDEDLRLSARHQRRQQVSQSVYAPPLPVNSDSNNSSFGSLQRSRSISTDDLSNDCWQQQTGEEELPCGDWRRVSKLRRSFQSQDYHNKAQSRPRPLPLDLPSSSVSVARIRAELENGRRLNTAMRNNHVDLAALDSILNTTAASVAAATAAANDASTAAAGKASQSSSKPQVTKRETFLTAASLQEIRGKLKKLSDESLYKEDFVAHQQTANSRQPATIEPPPPSAFRPVHNTHSLETRQRPKDNNSSEWHSRRKSYGFEKMSPPENRSIFRVDASTDSGLGRSGEQLGNWSPTERTATAAANGAGSTIIHFGRQQQVGKPAISSETEQLSKRHSIAVEETWRDIRKTSQVHVNGDSINGGSNNNSSSQLQRSSAQKRVEFCKTEVHFAAESGRVNIVETDGKPPPTQNFRRRRRTASGPLQSLVKSASVSSTTTTTSSNSGSTTTTTNNSSSNNVTHFGDDPTVRAKTIASTTVAYRATLMEPPELVTQPVAGTQVTVITKPLVEPRYSLLETTSSTSRHSYTSTSGVDTTDNETDELANIRGILKNKPVKPKPYHLGENIESADALWSVPATIKSENRESSPPSRDNAPVESPITTKSVAERVRIVEQRQFEKQQPSPAGNGYSTKINVNLGAEEWTETGRRRSSAQELLLQDLRAHQRILDEGLKSTSLIMKTMRSASEFDEAMRRLSIASIESALIQPTIVVPTPMLRSHSYQEEGSRRTSTTSISSSDLFGSTLYDSLPRTPLAPPRLKLLGNTQIPVSQQLTQLRRLYDAAEQEEDSADEEVKRYFRENSNNNNNNNSDSGGGTQCSSSPEDVVLKGTEYSSSWSRLKAKRTIWKIEAQEQTLQRTDLPKSNVMSIALHAPRLQKPKPTPPTLRIGQLVPVAKPRTLLVQPQPQPQPQQMPVHGHTDNGDNESGSESLKIVREARGARKLREHELSYFGVQHSPMATQTGNKLQATPSNPRRTLPTRSKQSHAEEATNPSALTTTTTTTTTKWQLLNDRPDLLRHSPQANDDGNNVYDNHELAEQEEENEPEEEEEHCYENIANELTTTFRVKSPSPGCYERKTDLQRDAQILSEMTRNADQTMKALSDEAAFKDQRRRSCSLQRRSAKPLATIDERVKADATKALSVARGTFASEARRNSRQSTPSPTRARSSSQSSIECCPRDRSRSSSRESMTHGGGSSDEQLSKQRVERLRMRTPKREKTRHEPAEHRSSRQSSSSNKPSSSSKLRSSSSSAAAVESKRSHHHSRHREKEHGSEHSTKHSSGSASASRLLRSMRVTEESRPRPSSSQRTSEREKERERARGSERQRDELTRSRGHSSRSRHSEPSAAAHKSSKSSRSSSSHNHDTSMSAHRKSTAVAAAVATAKATTKSTTVHKSTTATAQGTATTATATAPISSTTTTTTTPHNELTYVYVTNLANTQTAEDTDYASIDDVATATATATTTTATTIKPTEQALPLPLPPPRRKRKRSLLPVPIRTTATPTAAYEHRIKLEMIPQAASYSNQSTLRCKQPTRKSSLKCTQSTSSSFAFLPYLPAKRNSNVSHVYDNYLLYAAPATLAGSKLRPYQHNLSNDHAQLFGGSGRGGGAGIAAGNASGPLAGRLGSWPKRLRMRQVRSSVSTHQPFGICTCS